MGARSARAAARARARELGATASLGRDAAAAALAPRSPPQAEPAPVVQGAVPAVACAAGHAASPAGPCAPTPKAACAGRGVRTTRAAPAAAVGCHALPSNLEEARDCEGAIVGERAAPLGEPRARAETETETETVFVPAPAPPVSKPYSNPESPPNAADTPDSTALHLGEPRGARVGVAPPGGGGGAFAGAGRSGEARDGGAAPTDDDFEAHCARARAIARASFEADQDCGGGEDSKPTPMDVGGSGALVDSKEPCQAAVATLDCSAPEVHGGESAAAAVTIARLEPLTTSEPDKLDTMSPDDCEQLNSLFSDCFPDFEDEPNGGLDAGARWDDDDDDAFGAGLADISRIQPPRDSVGEHLPPVLPPVQTRPQMSGQSVAGSYVPCGISRVRNVTGRAANDGLMKAMLLQVLRKRLAAYRAKTANRVGDGSTAQARALEPIAGQNDQDGYFAAAAAEPSKHFAHLPKEDFGWGTQAFASSMQHLSLLQPHVTPPPPMGDVDASRDILLAHMDMSDDHPLQPDQPPSPVKSTGRTPINGIGPRAVTTGNVPTDKQAHRTTLPPRMPASAARLGPNTPPLSASPVPFDATGSATPVPVDVSGSASLPKLRVEGFGSGGSTLAGMDSCATRGLRTPRQSSEAFRSPSLYSGSMPPSAGGADLRGGLAGVHVGAAAMLVPPPSVMPASINSFLQTV